jgi:hypothetical protein
LARLLAITVQYSPVNDKLEIRLHLLALRLHDASLRATPVELREIFPLARQPV